MIEYRTGNILTAEVEALVNTVNCVGVMGRGIALQFRHAYPANYADYVAACQRGDVQPGRLLITETGHSAGPRYIINFPTKRNWRDRSRLEDIDSGLRALVTEIQRRQIRSLAVPPLGSGLGRLDWRVVRQRITTALAALDDVRVLIYEPLDDAPFSAVPAQPPKMTASRAAMIVLMQRYLAGDMHPSITLLEVHKLLYFLQEAGQPLKLSYAKALYGPYADNLRHVLKAVEGHFISGYADGGDQPKKPLELQPGAHEQARAVIEHDRETHQRCERVADLVDGFESPFGLELLATVHWVMTREGAADLTSIVRATHGWNQRKRQFSPYQIELARAILQEKGWIVPASPYAHAPAPSPA